MAASRTSSTARRAWAALSLGTTLTISSAAAADPAPHVRATLTYTVATEAASCPDRGTFVDAVAARLGYDPFVTKGDRSVSVSLVRRGGSFVGRLGMGGTKEIDSKSCAELVDALAMAAALGLDPDAAFRPEPPKPAPPDPEPPKPAPPDPEPRKPAPIAPPPKAEARLWLGPVGALGDTPSATLGLALGGRIAYRSAALELEVASTLPSGVSIGSGGRGTAEGAVTSGLLAACAGFSFVAVCGTGQLGFLYARSLDVDAPRSALSAYAGLGARIALTHDVTERLFVRLALDGVVTVLRSDLRIDGRSLWETSPVVGRLGTFVGVRF